MRKVHTSVFCWPAIERMQRIHRLIENKEYPIHRGEGLYELEGGFIVHFFSREMVERLAKGYQVLSVEEFEETELPKRLYLVGLRKGSE